MPVIALAATTNDASEHIDASGILPQLSDREFQRWSTLLRERTGIDVPSQRRSFLASGLAERLRITGLPNLMAYYRHLTSGAAGPLEWGQLVDQLTVQETRFFRDPASIEFVAQACHERAGDREHPVQVLSAGCATGEEAYTLAMAIDHSLGANSRFVITGTDISYRALATARRGEYEARRLPRIPLTLRERGVEPLARERFRVATPIRRQVCFLQMNLLSGISAPLPAMDVVFCQNVLIYFDRKQRQRLVEQLVARLSPGGLLVLGSGELMSSDIPALRRVGGDGILAFRRIASA